MDSEEEPNKRLFTNQKNTHYIIIWKKILIEISHRNCGVNFLAAGITLIRELIHILIIDGIGDSKWESQERGRKGILK